MEIPDLRATYHAAVADERDVAGVESVLEFAYLVGDGEGVTTQIQRIYV